MVHSRWCGGGVAEFVLAMLTPAFSKASALDAPVKEVCPTSGTREALEGSPSNNRNSMDRETWRIGGSVKSWTRLTTKHTHTLCSACCPLCTAYVVYCGEYAPQIRTGNPFSRHHSQERRMKHEPRLLCSVPGCWSGQSKNPPPSRLGIVPWERPVTSLRALTG